MPGGSLGDSSRGPGARVPEGAGSWVRRVGNWGAGSRGSWKKWDQKWDRHLKSQLKRSIILGSISKETAVQDFRGLRSLR